jgi:two-component system sensor histidine kinase PilS (NtrC family)
MQTKKQDIFWLILLRLIIMTSLLVSAVIIQYSTLTFIPIDPFYYLIVLSYILSLIYFIFYIASKRYTLQAYIQILFDLFLLTALVYISGGIIGTFYFLYVFEIIAASIVVSRKAAFLAAALSAIFYGMLIDAMYLGIIPHSAMEIDHGISLGYVINNIFIAWGVFFLVAFLVSHLTENLKRTRNELNLAQKELQAKKSLALAGEVSASLAHEIRNPLTAISGTIQVLKDELPLDSEQKKMMDIVVSESERITQSIEQFLSMASNGKRPFSNVHLSSVLEETLAILRKSGQLGDNYSIEGNYKSSDLSYYGSSHQFKQIFWNLIKNAIKAMPDGGTLAVDFTEKNDGKVLIEFKDSGGGIPEEARKRLFEPFFSGFEKGNGIGLAVVRGIIDDYDGEIKVSSEINEGTVITIVLPKSPR